MGVGAGLILLLVVVGIYFLPSIIAGVKDKKQLVAIIVLNFFLGWTGLGWIIALIWAVMEDD